MSKFCLFLICCLCFFRLPVQGQVISEKLLEEKTNWKNNRLPASMLYITTDKTIYLPTEVIWFAGYLLPYTKKQDTITADMLSVALISERGDVAMRKTYVITNLLCAGSLTLPDSIPPGNYQLIACTNLINDKKQPLQHFTTPIIIRSASAAPTFVTQFDMKEQKNIDTLLLSVSLMKSDGTPMIGKKDNKKNGLIRYGLPNKPTRTAYFDSFGSASLFIPKSELVGSKGILQTATTFEEKTKYFNLHSPLLTAAKVNLRFYPEGGDLVEDLLCNVAYEASFTDGRKAMVKAQLLDNGVVKDTITTDSTGMGIFTIIPKRSHIYSLKLIGTVQQEQQLFKLPQALEKGMVLNVQDAVVNDTLSLTIQSSIDSNVFLAITNMLSNEAQISPMITVGKAKKLQIPLSNIYKGLNSLTVLDSQGRPYAECLFFAHFNMRNSANIILNKTIVGTNQKIEATILLEDANHKSIGGMFTVACIRQNRLSGTYKANMETYYHVNYSLPASTVANLYDNKTHLEKVIRIQGWRRLLWQQLIKTPPPLLNGAPYYKASLKGQVKLLGKDNKLKGPFTIMSIKDSLPLIFTTDQNGRFYPTPTELASTEGAPNLHFWTYGAKGDTRQYIVELKDPMDSLIRSADFPFPNDSYNFKDQNLSQSSEMQLTGEPFVRQLQTVEIKGKAVTFQSTGYGVNECGDYVCGYAFLNCPVHTPQNSVTHLPIIGQTYSYYSNLSDLKKYIEVTYRGCQPDNMKGIYTAREFYDMQQLKKDNPEENFFLSTLYWNPMLRVLPDSKHKVDFNSSDAPGLYKIIIEGIADNGDFIYAEKSISVEK